MVAAGEARSLARFPSQEPLSLARAFLLWWGRGVVSVGGEDAPVGQGPRRTRPHPGARTKYIAPFSIQEKRERRGGL